MQARGHHGRRDARAARGPELVASDLRRPALVLQPGRQAGDLHRRPSLSELDPRPARSGRRVGRRLAHPLREVGVRAGEQFANNEWQPDLRRFRSRQVALWISGLRKRDPARRWAIDLAARCRPCSRAVQHSAVSPAGRVVVHFRSADFESAHPSWFRHLRRVTLGCAGFRPTAHRRARVRRPSNWATTRSSRS